ncbi:MAG: ABC transporter ATP-binding protein [Eubacteriales bacterium]|nr:ABC transporter ATP-binding protein [Eubacteriales bacterium]
MELKLENLTKTFQDVEAVSGIDYTMKNGVYGLLGVNGAGKTTLMRMICTLAKPTKGRILCNGQEIWQLDWKYRKILGYLPQEFGFYPEFTAEDYLRYIASIKGIPAAAAKKRVDELLVQVGMEKYRKKKMKRFSGGMKRRIGIAQAMLNNPKILVLDEPTAGLDPNERIRFRNLISELSEDRLVLLSTHIVSDVEYIANEILLMKEGKLKQAGTAYELAVGIPEQVWVCRVPRERAAEYEKRYRVANLRTLPDGVELRLLAGHAPAPDARCVEATLEDVFLYYFGNRQEGEGEQHAVL